MSVFYIDSYELACEIHNFHVTDEVFLSGTVYTARDAAHRKLKELIEQKKTLPFNLKGSIIYYTGPTPAREGSVIGSCGPTTSSRMDPYTPLFLDNGMIGMIGKGERSIDVINSIKKNSAVYFCALGGAGAIAASSVVECEVIAFPELGCESIKRLRLNKFPLIVGIDSRGRSIFDRK